MSAVPAAVPAAPASGPEPLPTAAAEAPAAGTADATLRGRVTSIPFRDERSGETVLRLAPERDNPGRVSHPVWGTVAGTFAKGEVITVTGAWTRHPTYGRTLRIRTLERTPPSSREGEITFLAGYILNMTRAQAQHLLESCGGLKGLIETCKTNPTRLDELLPKAKVVRARLRRATWDQRAMDLDAFVTLQSAGLKSNQVQALVKFFGAPGLRQIAQQNPYEFCQVPKVGFASAEKVAQFYATSQGRPFDPIHPDRLVYGLCDVVAQERNSGHVCLSPEGLVRQAIRALKLTRGAATEAALQEALARALARRLLVKDFDMIYTRGLHKAESDVAQGLARLMAGGVRPLVQSRDQIIKALAGTGLSDEQKEGVVTMGTSPVSILVGGPGRGKTHTLKSLLTLLAKANKKVLVLAPTGKAAKRAQEVTGQPCMTIHKACGLDREEDVHNKRYGKSLSRKDRLSADVVVVDETSMVDLALGFELVRRLRAGRTALILVGDPDQLPPVGAGQVLKDLLGCGRIPIARLTQVFRQANGSPIVDGADALNTGRLPEFQEAGYDVRLFDPTTARAHPGGDGDDALDFEVRMILRWMTQAVGRYAEDRKIHPIRDVQVYAPQKKGPLGLQVLNAKMQEVLNPGPDGVGPRIDGGFVARVGDKVMQIQNNYKLTRVGDAGEVTVMNGQIGYVVTARADRVEVKYDDVPTPVVYGQSSEFRQLAPAYAISIHRSQGSETPYAFVVLHRSMNPRLVNRPLIYTAWTRAKAGVAVFGSAADVERAAKNLDGTDRNSNLGARVQQATAPVTRAPLKMVRVAAAPAPGAPAVPAVPARGPVPAAPTR